MWRCKWAELKIKEFESMASEYSRRIRACDLKKRLAYEQLRVEEFGSKSLPYTPRRHRKKPLKRRKRKKVECITNTTEYMSRHNLFSYQESKRNDQDGSSAGDDFGNPVFPGQDLTGNDEFAYTNDWLTQEENSDFNEEIFRKIDLVHTRVQKMKSQLDLIMTKYGAKFSSSESLSHLVPGDLPSSSVRSPTFSACNGDTMSAGGLFSSMQQMSEYDLGDFVMPDTTVSSYGEAVLIPDIIESTVGLLSSVDVTQHQAHITDSCEKIVDNIFIHNEAAEMELRTFKQPHIESMENHQDADGSGDEESTNPVLPVKEEVDKDVTHDIHKEDLTLKSGLVSEIQVPKNKRKRGERKGGSGGWSRQLPGEPDGQT
ncbi:OLC1v1008190C2 [Oldenlandia corymbosa var. corymbosa]|nr:OLC1v1008190C2 [Oldenlandia corymbosa var. corymbosa]